MSSSSSFHMRIFSSADWVLRFSICFLTLLSSSSSSSPYLDPNFVDSTTAAFRNHTKISEFRIVNRRTLLECLESDNPYLRIDIRPNSSFSDEQNVTVHISGILKTSHIDWVAMISPATSDVSMCPWNKVMYAQTGDLARLPLLCHYPVKAQYMTNDPNYLSCEKRECREYMDGKCTVFTCNASLSFHVINIRTDIQFVYFGGGFAAPCIRMRSHPISFSNPKTPLSGHLSSTDSSATSMRLTWVSGDKGAQHVQYGEGKSAKSQVTTFSQSQMCGEDSKFPSPARDFGWHEPGFIHSTVMTGLHPSTNFSYRYGSDSVGWSHRIQFWTPPARGSDKLKFLIFGDMGKAPSDASAEHYIQHEWMKKDMASVNRSRTPWLIFTGHRHMYTSVEGILSSPDKLFVEAVEPLLLVNKVDLVLYGHVHAYERTCALFQSKCLAMPVKGTDGIDTYGDDGYSAPVHAVVGMAGFTLDPFPDTTENSWSLVRISEYGYARASATREELLFEFVNSNTTVEDSFRIIKKTSS